MDFDMIHGFVQIFQPQMAKVFEISRKYDLCNLPEIGFTSLSIFSAYVCAAILPWHFFPFWCLFIFLISVIVYHESDKTQKQEKFKAHGEEISNQLALHKRQHQTEVDMINQLMTDLWPSFSQKIDNVCGEKFRVWLSFKFSVNDFFDKLKIPRLELGSNPAKVLKFVVSQSARRIDVDICYRSSPPFMVVQFNDRPLFVISDLRIRSARFRIILDNSLGAEITLLEKPDIEWSISFVNGALDKSAENGEFRGETEDFNLDSRSEMESCDTQTKNTDLEHADGNIDSDKTFDNVSSNLETKAEKIDIAACNLQTDAKNSDKLSCSRETVKENTDRVSLNPQTRTEKSDKVSFNLETETENFDLTLRKSVLQFIDALVFPNFCRFPELNQLVPDQREFLLVKVTLMVVCGLGDGGCLLSRCKADFEDRFERVTFKVSVAGKSFESHVIRCSRTCEKVDFRATFPVDNLEDFNLKIQLLDFDIDDESNNQIGVVTEKLKILNSRNPHVQSYQIIMEKVSPDLNLRTPPEILVKLETC